MKRTLLFFFTFIVATKSVRRYADITNDEGLIEGITKHLEISRDEVQACINKTSVTLEDIMHIDIMTVDNLQTVDFDKSALKIGCMFACLGQKTEMMNNAGINVDKIKQIFYAKSRIVENKNHKLDAFTDFMLSKIYEAIDTCANQVKDETNECKEQILRESSTESYNKTFVNLLITHYSY